MGSVATKESGLIPSDQDRAVPSYEGPREMNLFSSDKGNCADSNPSLLDSRTNTSTKRILIQGYVI